MTKFFLISIQYKSRRSNTYELKVRAMMSEAVSQCKGLYDFECAFNMRLKEMPKESYAPPPSFYKCEADELYHKLEIWHLDSYGDKDRLVAVITRVEVDEEAYRKVFPHTWLD